MLPEEELARSLLLALQPGFEEREAAARQLAELLLDAVAAALPLTRNEPSEGPLSQLETLSSQLDVYSWDGAPGWDVVLARGLPERTAILGGASILDGLGAKRERTQQRGELKRRAHAEADRLVKLAREAARFGAARGGSAEVLDELPTLPGPSALIAAHATLLRLVGLAAAAPLLSLPEEPMELPPPGEAEFLAELSARDLSNAHEEWLARLLADNPAAAQAPAFRTFFAGLSQTLRAAAELRKLRDGEAIEVEPLLGAIVTWQPARWPSLRAGAPSSWIASLCPPAAQASAATEAAKALDLQGRLWFAKGLSLPAFAALAALFIGRAASAVALFEEAGGGAESR